MLRAVFLFLMALAPVFAQEHALVKATDSWRYMIVRTNLPLPTTNWNAPAFDDSSWPEAPASFYSVGGTLYGWPEATGIAVSSFSTAGLFRKSFVAVDPSNIRSLVLRIDYQNGFVAYLNGVEVMRRGLPGTTNPVPVTAHAAYHVRGTPELLDLSAAIPLLNAGTNLLAIQVHRSDPSIDLELSAELLANFTRGPFVQNATTNSIQIIWRTVDETTGLVRVGLNGSEQVFAIPSGTTGVLHAVTITNLAPGGLYRYQVESARDGETARSQWASFRTLKARGAPISFQVLGDSGAVTLGQYSIASHMRQRPTDLVMHVGDIVYPYFHFDWADLRHFSIYREQATCVPWFMSMGNHDAYGGGLTAYQEVFYLPTNNVSNSEHWYSFDHGDAHFVVLHTDTQIAARYDPESPQYRWLEQDLANTTQPWKFIFYHHVTRSSSAHSGDDFLLDGVLDKYALQMHVEGLAQFYGVQAIFNGHDHNFERFAAFGGVNTFISGGGGAFLYGQILLEPGSMQYYYAHNFLNVTIDGPDMTVEAIGTTGRPFDRFYRSMTSTETFNSTWGYPYIEDGLGDGGGNITGQRFPFHGPSMRTRAGLRGNLGRVHVRNDAENLYLGFEQAALHPNQVIAVFIENPLAPGISDMATLGDGQVGGEVDGLDLLHQLAFQDFRPSIACLLGDEFGDGRNQRTFQRAEMRWAAGQGVFRLDSAFSDIAGTRLQQFNRDPQTPPIFPESNADFISVSIPLVALAFPTNSIRVGAIILEDDVSAPIGPKFDTAMLGKSFATNTVGRFVLEPATIQLARDVFRFRAERISAGRLRFKWDSVPNAQYWIQTTSSLSEEFRDIQGAPFPMTATSVATETELNFVVDGGARFFRLRTN